MLRLLAACSVTAAMSACHQPTSVQPREEPYAPIVSGELKDNAASVDSAPERISIDVWIDDPDRWLFVEKVRDGAVGAWATGSFNTDRNKLTIETRDVQQFAIDTDRVPINWERLVILGIDGRNSELRKRDYSVLHIALDEHGRWVVWEP